MTERLTLQEMFDNAVRGIYAQGERSYDDGMQCCMYRLELPKRTLKCALGYSIPDNLYDPLMEGKGPLRLREDFPKLRAIWPVSVSVLGELQSCHDDQDEPSFMEGFLGRAWEFAQDRRLTWPEDVPRPD